jgi:L-ascorbate metabolism protein UlaG (beta-lactamase superfamily)
MVINWYGEGCFKIQTSGITILTDPFGSESGLTPARLKPEVLLKTLIPFPISYAPNQANLQIVGPGGYEFKGIEFFGWPLIKESTSELSKTVYLVKAEDLNLCFLGHIANNLEPSILEKLAEVDLLFIPAGGKPFVSQETAGKLIKQIEPRLVVASFFKIPGLKRKADDVKEFLKGLELKAEPQEKLAIKKKDLPKKMEVVVLKT